MIITDFKSEHVGAAMALALENYKEERGLVPTLPTVDGVPELTWFAENGQGAAAFEEDKLVGFICACPPWDGAFGTAARGIFVPAHAHGAVRENRVCIYRRMYQAAAERWTAQGATMHAVALYAHDEQAREAFFSYGFGLRCVDAIRGLLPVEGANSEGLNMREIGKGEVGRFDKLRRALSEHLGESPCFMYSSEEELQAWLKRAHERDSRLFAAERGGMPVAFIEICGDGECFAAETDGTANICGAYCVPELRGTGAFKALLNYVMSVLASEGYVRLGVDFESFNPTALGFWGKHFTAYTNSVVRRVDEGILHRNG